MMNNKVLILTALILSLSGCSGMPLVKKSNETKLTETLDAESLFELRKTNALLQSRLEKASQLLDQAMLDDAEHEFNEALKIVPQNPKALAGLQAIADRRKHSSIVEEARQLMDNGDAFMAERRVRQVLMEDASNRDAIALIEEIQQHRDDKKRMMPVLKNTGNPDVSLEFREANLKMVFEVLSRNTGINFILDKDIRPDQKTSIYIKSAPLKEVLDAFLTANQLQKKIINETTVIIYPDNPMKAHDYEELVLRTFYLANADIKQVSGFIKSMLNVKDVYTDEKNNLLIVRDTEDTVKMVERLVRSMDVAEPEVMLEIEVYEIDDDLLSDLGVMYPNSLTVINKSLTIKGLQHINSSNLGINSNPVLNFLNKDTVTNLLANPSIRVKNREKAKIQVGDRIPIKTTTTVNQTSTDSIQYLDTGLKLEVEPVIAVDNNVTISVNLEVSSGTKDAVPTISTRNATTKLTLKDGETQVLAGLIRDDSSDTKNKVPGLGDIPLFGRLFSDKNSSKHKIDLVLSITPHVIRNIAPQKSQAIEVPLGSANKIGVSPTNVIQGVPAALAPFMNPSTPSTQGTSVPSKVSPTQQPSTPANVAPQNSFSLPNGLSFPLGGQAK